MKTIYIAPETEVVKLSTESGLLDESKWGVIDDSGSGVVIPVHEGDPTDPGVHFAKHHNLWDDGEDDTPDNWGDSWSDEK